MKRNVKFDRPKPSSEEILAQRNFDALFEQYKQLPGRVVKKPFWQKGAFYASAAAIAAVFTGVVLYLNNSEIAPTKGNNELVNTTPTKTIDTVDVTTVASAIPAPEYKRQLINTAKEQVIDAGQGITITLSPNSLADASGVPVEGEVEVRYRTISDPVDLFLSNIPMQAGNASAWESGAMVEVLAFKNGTPLTVRKGQTLRIDLPEMSGYNVYSLESASASWVPVLHSGKASASETQGTLLAIDELSPEKRAQYEALLEQQRIEEYKITAPLLPALPTAPRAADRKKNRFNVDFKVNEFPEMKSWGNVVFEVDESQRKFDVAIYKTEWEDVQLLRSGPTGYQILLRKGVRTEVVDVHPALEGDALAAAQTDYNAAVEKRNTILAKRENDLATLRSTVTEKCNALRKPTSVPNTITTKETEIKTGHFGVFAVLRKINWPTGFRSSSLTILGEDGQTLLAEQICHIQQGVNSLFRWNSNPAQGFSYNPSTTNQLWILSNGKLYAASAEQLAKPSAQLQVTAKPVPASATTNAETLRRYFGI